MKSKAELELLFIYLFIYSFLFKNLGGSIQCTALISHGAQVAKSLHKKYKITTTEYIKTCLKYKD